MAGPTRGRACDGGLKSHLILGPGEKNSNQLTLTMVMCRTALQGDLLRERPFIPSSNCERVLNMAAGDLTM